MTESSSALDLTRSERDRLIQRLDDASTRQISPLASLASELLYELRAPAPDWGRVFLLQIDLFEVAVALLGFINLSELATRGSCNAVAREPLAKLRDGAKLSTGHWWALLRATSLAVMAPNADPREPARIASALYAGGARDRASESALQAKLDAVPNVRNRVKGHAWTLPAEQYAQHAHALLGTTTALFDALEGFTRCTLLRVVRSTNGDGYSDVDAFVLRGDPRRHPRVHLRCANPLVPGRLYLAPSRSLDVETVHTDALLDLHPFVQWRQTPEGHEGVFLAQGIDKHGLDLAGVLGGARLSCKRSREEAETRLDALMPPTQPEATDIDRLRARAVELARELLDASGTRASYDTRNYLVRPRIAQHLDEARSVVLRAEPGASTSPPPSTRTLTLISGPSGSGKTALCCHAAERWLVAAPADRLVVVVRWSELLAADEHVDRWWTQRFGEPLTASCAKARKSNSTIVLYLDSVDRLRGIDALTNQLCNFVTGEEYGNLRVKVTATDGVAGRIARAFAQQHAALAHALHRWSVPALSPDEAKRLYELLGEADTGRAAPISDSALGYLKSPLLVRLARSLQSADAHGPITPGRLLRAHADRTVLSDPIRAHLAMGLVRHVLETASKSVPLDRLLADPELRPALLANQESAPLQTLVREQVLMIDRVQSTSKLPMPAETRIAFTFDAQLDYLVFLALHERSRGGLAALGTAHRDAAPFGPLVGGLRVLIIESLHTDAHPDDELVALVRNLSAGLRDALLREVLGAGLTRDHAAHFIARIARPAVGTETGMLAASAVGAFDRLVVGGLLDEAFEMAELAATHAPCVESRALLRRAIRMDAWSRDAERAERRAREFLASNPSLDHEEHLDALDAHSFALAQLGRKDDRHAVDVALCELAARAAPDAPEALVAHALAKARLHDDAKNGAQRDEAYERALTLVGSDRELACRTKLAIADVLANRHEPAQAQRTRVLANEALTLSRELGDAALEAHACEVVAHAAPAAGDGALPWIEEGLLAAGASRCRGATSRLLQRRARIHLGEGRYEEARADSQAAAQEATEARHQTAAMQMRLHVQLTACWELGQPGLFAKLVEEIREDARKQRAPFEEALSHLLDARIAVCLGDAARAVRSLDRVDDMRAAHADAKKVEPALIRGDCEWLSGNHERAIQSWKVATQYGDGQKFADFVYQPRLAEARAVLAHARGRERDPSRKHDAANTQQEREKVVLDLRALIDSQHDGQKATKEASTPVAPSEGSGGARGTADVDTPRTLPYVGQLARYDGEISMLLAWALWDLGRRTEAEVWERRAQEWFTAHPQSLHAPEHHALVLLRLAESERPGDAPREFDKKTLERILGQARRYVLTPVRQQADTFASPAARDAFVAHHPAIAHLRRVGIAELELP